MDNQNSILGLFLSEEEKLKEEDGLEQEGDVIEEPEENGEEYEEEYGEGYDDEEKSEGSDNELEEEGEEDWL